MSKARLNAQHAMRRVSENEKLLLSKQFKPSPVKVTIQSTENLPITRSGKLRECKECKYSNNDCTFCSLLNKHIYPYQYACFEFITDEEYEKKRIESIAINAAQLSAQWQATQIKEEEKCNWLLTLMIDMIVGSQILLEDFERRSDSMFKNNPFPDKEDVSNHKSDKDWIFTHKYAFSSMKKQYDGMKKKFESICNKIRTTFESTIQKHIVEMCTEKETNKLDEKKYTAIDINAAEFTRLMMLVMNKTVGNDENFNKIVDFIAQLDGEDVFSPNDISRFKIK